MKQRAEHMSWRARTHTHTHEKSIHDADLQGVPDWQQGVLGVLPLDLASRAKVVVGTHAALEAHARYRTFAAVARHVGVHAAQVGWGRGRHRRRRKRIRGKGLNREVATVLSLLWKHKKNQVRHLHKFSRETLIDKPFHILMHRAKLDFKHPNGKYV